MTDVVESDLLDRVKEAAGAASRLQSLLDENRSSCESLVERLTTAKARLAAQRKQHRETLSLMSDAETVAALSRDEEHKVIAQALADRERWLAQLESENTGLKENMGEYEATLDLLMDKHKRQVLTLRQEAKQAAREAAVHLESEQVAAEALQRENVRLVEQVEQMRRVMQKAVEEDDQGMQDAESTMMQLVSENQGLRQMLQLSGVEIVESPTARSDPSPPQAASPSPPMPETEEDAPVIEHTDDAVSG